jgi:hypothetical protein
MCCGPSDTHTVCQQYAICKGLLVPLCLPACYVATVLCSLVVSPQVARAAASWGPPLAVVPLLA